MRQINVLGSQIYFLLYEHRSIMLLSVE